MNCKEVENKLIFLSEGDLLPSEKENIQVHLNECSPCYSLHLQLNHSIQMITEEKETEINPYFTNKTLLKANEKYAAFEYKPSKETFLFSFGKKLSYSFILVVGIVIGIWIGSSLHTDAANIDSANAINTEFFNNDDVNLLTLK